MTTQTPEKTSASICNAIINAVMQVLGEPISQSQHSARKAFELEDYDLVRKLAAANLGDSYLRSLTYLCSVPKNPPTLAVIAAEACRAAADWQREKTLQQLNESMTEVFLLDVQK